MQQNGQQQTIENSQKIFFHSPIPNNQTVKQKYSMKMKQNILILVLLVPHLIFIVQSQCDKSPINETLYISETSSCQIKYDPCSDFSVLRCSKQDCLATDKTQCITTMETSYGKTCRQYCCSNIQDSQNSDKINSLAICRQLKSQYVQPPASNAGSYILIATFCVLFVALVVGICFCKKRRNQNNPTGINTQSNLPPTAVNLAAFQLDAQGPYFVNSNDSCAICLDSKVNLRTHCNHFYHANCLSEWLKKKPNNPCPLCMGITYNPVKVYCIECHAGDKLVNINIETPMDSINQYDMHKCQNCKKFGNQTFTLSEQHNENPLNKKNFGKKQVNVLNYQKDDVSIDAPRSQKSKRRNRKVQSLKKVSYNSKGDLEDDIIDQSQKNFHPNHNKSNLGP